MPLNLSGTGRITIDQMNDTKGDQVNWSSSHTHTTGAAPMSASDENNSPRDASTFDDVGGVQTFEETTTNIVNGVVVSQSTKRRGHPENVPQHSAPQSVGRGSPTPPTVSNRAHKTRFNAATPDHGYSASQNVPLKNAIGSRDVGTRLDSKRESVGGSSQPKQPKSEAPSSFQSWLFKTNIEDASWKHVDRLFPLPGSSADRHYRLVSVITKTWIQYPSTSVLWLHGKSSIDLETVACRVAAHSAELNRPVFSYFFARADEKTGGSGSTRVARNSYQSMLATLATQARHYYPTFQQMTDENSATVEASLPQAASIRDQFMFLFSYVLRGITESREVPPNATLPLVVINGIDRCEGQGTAYKLLEQIIKSATVTNPPALFLITSQYSDELAHELKDVATINMDTSSSERLLTRVAPSERHYRRV